MPVRLKQIGMGILLCLALAVTLICAVRVAQAFSRFAQNRYLAQSGDVRTIRPWMTIPYISREYHVPEAYLLQTLHISDARSVRHTTLYVLAGRLRLTPNQLLAKIQSAILTYRKQHPSPTPPTPPTPPIASPHSAIPPPTGRMTPA